MANEESFTSDFKISEGEYHVHVIEIMQITTV
uniref:Uncharacterized protein n=1 Tax=Anguilla anguilla TaxID=7936 RepID=A0A0E9TP55_ANGAN